MRFSQKKLFLLDMDGTIYLDDDLFDGTLEFLEYVKEIGGKYFFLTNLKIKYYNWKFPSFWIRLK